MKSIKLRIGKISYTALNKIPILLLAVVSCLTVSTVFIDKAVAADSFKGSSPTVPVPVLESRIKCAEQGGTCAYPAGTQTMRYGANGHWLIKSVFNGAAGPILCNNEVWTDPVPGSRNACYYAMTKR